MCIMQCVIFQRLFYYPSILVTIIASVESPDRKSKFYSETLKYSKYDKETSLR
jgi:hypothetical protein